MPSTIITETSKICWVVLVFVQTEIDSLLVFYRYDVVENLSRKEAVNFSAEKGWHDFVMTVYPPFILAARLSRDLHIQLHHVIQITVSALKYLSRWNSKIPFSGAKSPQVLQRTSSSPNILIVFADFKNFTTSNHKIATCSKHFQLYYHSF